VLGALGLGSLAAYMMLRKDDKPSEYETLGNKDEDGRRSGNSASPVKVKALEETWIDECIKDHLIPLLTNRISALGTEIRTAEASLDVRQPTESKRKQTNGKIQRCRNDISTLKTQLEQLKTETDRRKTIRAEIEKLVTTEIHMDHRVINNAGSVRYHYIPNFVFAQAFGSFLQMLGIPSGQSVEAFKTKILSLRVSAHNEIPFRSEGIGAAKLNPAERMYVPQAYFGFYWIPNDSGTFPIQYLSTSGAAPCLVLTFFAGNAQGKLSAIAHLDGTHNSKKKLKTYVRDIFEWMKTLFKSMPTIQANIMVSAENRITPCVLDSSFNLSPREYVENLYDTLPYTLQLLSSLDDSNPAKPWVLYLSSEKDETDSVMIKYVTVRENNERIEGVIKPADLPEVSLPDSDDLSQFEAIKSGLLTCAIGKGDIFETRDCDLTEEVRQSLNEQANESSVELNLQIYKSTLKSIDVAIQVTNGEFFTYKEDLDPNALRTRADSAPTSIFQFDDQQAIIRAAAKKPTEPEAPPSFGEAMQLKDHGTLFYLKPRGSVCQIDPHFFMLRLKWFGCGDFNADTFYGIDRQYTPTFDRSCALADQLPVQQAEAQAFESKLGSDAFKAFFGI
nr:hypothetical protein [Gammaproteobacteria bacterium]